MKDGELAESGTHKELMRLGGEYSNLYNSQVTPTVDQDSSYGECSDSELSDDGDLGTPDDSVIEIDSEFGDLCEPRSKFWPRQGKTGLCYDAEGMRTK